MKKITTLLPILALLITPLTSHGAVIFSDSFESDNTGYGNPNSSNSVPAWNDPVAGANGESDLDRVFSAPTSSSSDYIPGQDGSQYAAIYTAAAGSEPVETDTITTVNGDAGTFQADTNYTLSVLMAQNSYGGDGSPGDLFNGILQLRDGTTSSVLDSTSHNFATGDADFHEYSFSFSTATDPGIVGDSIQIGLEASNSAGSFQDVAFDDVTLASAAVTGTTPEPATFALLGLGALALILVGRRTKQIS